MPEGGSVVLLVLHWHKLCKRKMYQAQAVGKNTLQPYDNPYAHYINFSDVQSQAWIK